MAAKAAFLGAVALAWAFDAGAWAWPIGLAAAAIVLRIKRLLRLRAATPSIRPQLACAEGAVDRARLNA
jgi:hypothetical protein